MELELDEDESEEEKVDNVRQRKATSAQLKKLKEVGHSLLLGMKVLLKGVWVTIIHL